MCFTGGGSDLAKAAQGSAQAAALGWGRLVQCSREATAFAVIGLGQVDELEVEAEGARQPVRGGEIELTDAGDGLLEVGCGILCRGAVLIGFATGDGGAAKVFDGFVEWFAGLFAENISQQRAERADVAAQWSLFEVGGDGL